MLKFAASAEQLKVAWGTVAKQDAPGILDKINNIAKETPYSIGEVSNSIMKLYNTGLRGDELYATFQKLGDTAGAVGAPIDTVIAAYSKMAASGRVGAEEMNMLSDAGVNAWGILADAMGKPVEEVRKLSEEGKLGADSVNALRDAMGKQYSGGMEAQSKTFYGKLSTLIDTIQQGLLPWFDKLIDGLKPFFDFITNNPKIVILGATLLALVPIITTLTSVFGAVSAVATALSVSMWAVTWPILAIIAAVILVIAIFLYWNDIVAFVSQKWGEFTNFLTQKFNEAGQFITNKWNELIAFFQSIPTRIGEFFSGIGTMISNYFNSGIENIKNMFNGLLDWFKTFPQKIGDAFSGLGDIIKQSLSGAINLLPGPLQGPLKTALGLFDTQFEQLLDNVGTITLDTSRFDFLPSQMASQTYNNQQSYTFNKGIESPHERVKLRVDMSKVRGR